MSLTRRGKNSLQYRVKLHYRIRSNYSHVIRRGFENSRCCNSKGEYIAASIIQKKNPFLFSQMKHINFLSFLFVSFLFDPTDMARSKKRKKKGFFAIRHFPFNKKDQLFYYTLFSVIIRYFPSNKWEGSFIQAVTPAFKKTVSIDLYDTWDKLQI